MGHKESHTDEQLSTHTHTHTITIVPIFYILRIYLSNKFVPLTNVSPYPPPKLLTVLILFFLCELDFFLDIAE